jgi:medium-chain acyl-[acyl-carrier-protein] hydrolase
MDRISLSQRHPVPSGWKISQPAQIRDILEPFATGSTVQKSMEIKKIWLEKTYVRSAETDFLSRWKLSSFFAAMVEAAAHHADHLGYGFQSMIDRDMIWILSRLKIRFYDFPRIEDQVTIQTWPKSIQQKIFFMRDYQVMDGGGRRYASATSAYVLINPRVRRMIPPQSLGGALPDNRGLDAIAEPLDKIPPVELLEEKFTTVAGYSTVDLMGHVNNTRYIDWVSDCFSFAEHQSLKPTWLQINYLNEVKPAQPVTLLRGRYPDQANTWYVIGNNLATGARAFEAQIGWESQ